MEISTKKEECKFALDCDENIFVTLFTSIVPKLFLRLFWFCLFLSLSPAS